MSATFYRITNDQRHLVYQHARQTLNVLHAAQVSYAFLHYAQEHGLERAISIVPALIADAPGVSPDLWVEADAAAADPTQAVIAALVASGQLAEVERLLAQFVLTAEPTDD